MSETEAPQDTGDVTPDAPPAAKKPAAKRPVAKKPAAAPREVAPAPLFWRVTRAGEMAGLGAEGTIKRAGVLAPQTGALHGRGLIEPTDPPA